MEVILCQPRGFCAGVVRAVEIVERALDRFGPPVYVLHEIVHNRHVVQNLERRGAVFVEELDEIPKGSVIVFSAHGVSQAIQEAAGDRSTMVVDATCPLVRKVHMQVRRYEGKGKDVVLIGHTGHPEVEGTRGQSERGIQTVSTEEDIEKLEITDPSRVAYVTQTTLSVDDTKSVIDDLRDRFPEIEGPQLDDICYATQNRQNAVRSLEGQIDVLLVVGARNSSNSNRLRELGEKLGIDSYLVEDAEDLDASWFQPDTRIGVTAGASAPESLVQGVLARLRDFGDVTVSESTGVEEKTIFPMPSVLAAGTTAG